MPYNRGTQVRPSRAVVVRLDVPMFQAQTGDFARASCPAAFVGPDMIEDRADKFRIYIKVSAVDFGAYSLNYLIDSIS